MFRNRIFLKSLAIFFILEMVISTVWPTVSYALTAGPTAPEATSFEPVDTTDMVNLATGDLAYNIPLLEVPGPSGGYPLSLSYHAGIMPDEEASWVGLGWTLNPGAINRNVNGFADDHNNVQNIDRFFWEGGETHTLDIGLTMGISGVGGVSGGLSFSSDTYQGFSVGTFGKGAFMGLEAGARSGEGGYLGFGVNYGPLQAGIGVSSNNGPYANLGLSYSAGSSVKLSTGIGLSTNFKSIDGYAETGVSVGSMMSASIQTSSNGGVTSSISAMGFTGVHNGNKGKISTESYGITLPLPLFNIGYNYQRYWIDETVKVDVNGTLYNPTTIVSGFDKKAYDTYSLLDPSVGFVENPDPDKVLGGSFLSFDSYNVNAQGLGGGIKPYTYKNLIFRQNRKVSGSGYQVKQYPYAADKYRIEPIEFRFINDFSNKYLNDGGSIASGSPPLIPLFGSNEKTGELANQTDGIKNGHLAGSRHIEWYTNDQILNNDNSKNPDQEGFIDCRATGFTRVNAGSKGSQIGGFKITNESGVTYHFALPAYVYNEYQRSENIDDKTGKTFNELTKKEPYAYTWYLTAVTGPDYVDRSQTGPADGILNEYDWGYWVEFEYGKWTDFYTWRNPGEGMTQDLDDNFQNFSEGLKELYYLDAIRTKTHTALFTKSIRYDAKGSLYLLRNKTALNDESKVTVTSATREGGYIPQQVTNTCKTEYFDPPYDIRTEDQGSITYTARPTSVKTI